MSPHQLHQPPADGQSEPRAGEAAGCRTVDLIEGFEQQRLILGGDADPRVADHDPQLFLLPGQRQTHAADGGELHGIAKQVAYHLGEADGIP